MKKPEPDMAGLPLLGGISAHEFLRDYWQKKPLLIRGALPGFSGVLSPDELAGLACEDEVQSRLVRHADPQWQVEQGPFDETDFAELPERDWTLLVQGVNHHLPEAAELLQQFNFIPYARLDDLMVSYAPDGGGVGPHFDSYDVFLLQGQGQRLWRVSEQQDLSIVEDAPLRILQRFDTEQEWLLQPGDMLYLPPRLAHWGIAVGECMTYSIGFRAPSAQELGHEFLSYLQEHLYLPGLYADPDLQLQSSPALIAPAMQTQVADVLSQIRWDAMDVARFLGRYLSEPKPHVQFTQRKPAATKGFLRKALQTGVGLDLKTLMLYDQHHIYLNGESMPRAPQDAWLLALADQRMLDAQSVGLLPAAGITQLSDWYQLGYIQPLE
ncbi:cupin domain-containing protein [Methylobacillus flagellatus]|uniref:cupin domain-containing protein n=1 Tax=Methylobacillus flagellatus TaxID=405 RepID=UPI002570979E|nr:cupin domain-containing protein [Methylobacillus flagellatus]